jgi:hypothetical protein
MIFIVESETKTTFSGVQKMTESIDTMLAKLTGAEVAHLTADSVVSDAPVDPHKAYVAELKTLPTAELRKLYSAKLAAYYELELEQGYKMKRWVWEAEQAQAIIERRIIHDGEVVEGWTLSGYYK